MNDELRGLNDTEQQAMDGSPAAVRDAAGYINIKFQCGPVKEKGVNGTSIENVIGLLIRRLEGFQAGPFASKENEYAIRDLKAATMCLEERTKKRVEQGVEGTNRQHVE